MFNNRLFPSILVVIFLLSGCKPAVEAVLLETPEEPTLEAVVEPVSVTIASGVRIEHNGKTSDLFPVDHRFPNSRLVDSKIQTRFYGDFVTLFVEPPHNSGLYPQFLILNLHDLGDEQRILLNNQARITQFDDVPIEPDIWHYLGMMDSNASWAQIGETFGELDYVFFLVPTKSGEVPEISTAKLMFYDSPFPKVRYVLVVHPDQAGSATKLAALAPRLQTVTFAHVALSIPWNLIGHSLVHYLHPPIHEYLFSLEEHPQLLSVSQTPRMMMAPGGPFESTSEETIIIEEPTERPPTAKPTATRVKTSTPTSTAGKATLRLDCPAYCRAGPSTAFEKEWSFEAGTKLPILGTDGNGWWLVEVDDPRTRTKECWIGAGIVEGDTSRIPIVDTPPLPAQVVRVFYLGGTVILTCKEVENLSWEYSCTESGLWYSSSDNIHGIFAKEAVDICPNVSWSNFPWTSCE